MTEPGSSVETDLEFEPELSNKFVIQSNTDFNETVSLVEAHSLKFVDTFISNNLTYFIFQSTLNISKRSFVNESFDEDDFLDSNMQKMSMHMNITFIEREKILERSKRDFVEKRDLIDDDALINEIPVARPISTRTSLMGRTTRVAKDSKDKKKFGSYSMEDPMWPFLWYMNRHTFNKNLTDMNITSAWIMGYTGRGISVTFLDDGIERNHTDIVQNYDPNASYDFNDNDSDPLPRYDVTNENKHGTRCAGEVAATGNNSICSIGIAYNAGIGGIRMLDGPITDSMEAQSLSFNNQHIHIYSASWGPTDNGKQLDGPGRLVSQALEDGVRIGRNGLGSIFVWASGNGGTRGDSCSADGYVNSIYTFSISSVTDQGTKPWYLEECASILATTYSSGDIRRGQKSIATTDLNNKCTTRHTATSAAAPIAAGIIALALEANPNLTWRDVMFLIALTSRPKVIQSNNYIKNKAGFLVSSRYGFGLMDAGRMVELAQKWEQVPKFRSCHAKNSSLSKESSKNMNRMMASIQTNGCMGMSNEVNFIEQVQVIFSLRTPRRGEIEAYLTSPMGTRHQILYRRSRDKSHRGFKNWKFNTLQLWGEHAKGEWTLEIERNHVDSFVLDKFELLIHGTKEMPSIYKEMPNNNH